VNWTTLLGLCALAGCGGRLVAEQAVPLAGDAARLEWTATAPGGQGSFWLAYRMRTAGGYDVARGKSRPRYRLEGRLDVRAGDTQVYGGPLRLAHDAAPTDAVRSTTVVGARQTCGGDGCTLAGRLHLLDLAGVAPGVPLTVSLDLPATGEEAAVESLSLQLRAK